MARDDLTRIPASVSEDSVTKDTSDASKRNSDGKCFLQVSIHDLHIIIMSQHWLLQHIVVGIKAYNQTYTWSPVGQVGAKRAENKLNGFNKILNDIARAV